MKIPKGFQLIEVDEIKLIEKDEIQVSNEKDFIKLCKSIGFKSILRKRYTTSMEYSDYYYAIGSEVMYIFNEQIPIRLN